MSTQQNSGKQGCLRQLLPRITSMIRKYSHALPVLIYAPIYITWFVWLENTITKNYRIIHLPIDDHIPFCELFVIPYFLWFAYVIVILFFLFLKDKDNYYRMCIFLFSGMTIFLLISTLFPNGQHLRPVVMPRDNIFTDMIASLYRTDTHTNLWPSIHVYNSLSAHIAIMKCQALRQKRLLRAASFLLCTSIILSTCLIKQHSVFDVITAFILSAVMYGLVYSYDILMVSRNHGQTPKDTAAQP